MIPWLSGVTLLVFIDIDSVEELINPTEHPLDPNDNYLNDPTNNNIENLPNSDKSKPPGIAESPQNEKADEYIANKDTYNNNVAPVTVTNFINLPPFITEPHLPLTTLLSPASTTPLTLAWQTSLPSISE